jgi:hypothetical protein
MLGQVRGNGLIDARAAAFGLAAGGMHAGRVCRRHVFGTTVCLFSKLTSPCRYRMVACS